MDRHFQASDEKRAAASNAADDQPKTQGVERKEREEQNRFFRSKPRELLSNPFLIDPKGEHTQRMKKALVEKQGKTILDAYRNVSRR